MKKNFVGLSLWLVVISGLANAATPKKLNVFPEGERVLYGQIVEAYKANQLSEILRLRQSLARNYPDSIHLDNAYYLSGMVQLQHNRLGEALNDFRIVRDKYTSSNKRPAAMFAAASTYSRLNLKPQATQVWRELIKDYPGSPEAQRARMQLKLVSMAPRK